VRRPFPSGNHSGGSEGATVTAVTKRQACSDQAPHQAPVRFDSPSRRTTDRRHEVSEASTGWGKAPARAIAAGGANARRSSSHRPLARQTSAGCRSGQAARETESSRTQPFAARARYRKAPGSGEQAVSRATVTRSCEARTNRSRARGSYRLQKSTSGAWPLEPSSEELGEHSSGSSSSARERGRREEASEAGSPAAKPRDRWRALTKRKSAKALDWRALVDERRSGSGKLVALTCDW
jgi:hypothetical protein